MSRRYQAGLAAMVWNRLREKQQEQGFDLKSSLIQTMDGLVPAHQSYMWLGKGLQERRWKTSSVLPVRKKGCQNYRVRVQTQDLQMNFHALQIRRFAVAHQLNLYVTIVRTVYLLL